MFNDESNKNLGDNTQENVSIKTNDMPAVNNNTVVEKEQVKSNIIETTDENFKQHVLENPKIVISKFSAVWCAPCKQLDPILEEIANEMQDQVVVTKHDIDNNPNQPTKYGVRGIPTMLLFKGGELKATKVGATTKSNIISFIKENI